MTQSEQFENVVQQLQASHQILHWIERAKASSEFLIDNLPVIFAVIDESGNILRGNKQLADILECSFENLMSHSFAEAFTSENWKIMHSHLTSVRNDVKEIEFELETASGEVAKSQTFSWRVAPFTEGKDGRWIVVFGMNVSRRKQTEQQLGQLYSNIPLGLLRLNSELKIVSPYSAYAEVLLGADLEGKHINEVLFEPAWNSLSVLEQEAIKILPTTVGEDDFQFFMIREHLPSTVVIGPQGDLPKRKLDINLGAILQNERIEGFFLLVENRRDSRTPFEEHTLSLEERHARRYVEVRSIPQHQVRVVYRDFSGYFHSLQGACSAGDVAAVARYCHSIKGTARIVGLSHLADLTHYAEEELKQADQSASIHEILVSRSLVLIEEWNEIRLIFKVVFENEIDERDAEVESDGIALLESRLKFSVEKTADALNKKVVSKIELSALKGLPNERVARLSECLMHLVTNAIDHGLESSTERISSGKNPAGTLNVIAESIPHGVRIRVVDDGRGLDAGKILASAKSKGIAAAETATNAADIFALLFEPNFSTRETATVFSGHGIGLPAVLASAREIDAEVRVFSDGPGSGCTFEIKLNTQ